MIREEIMLPKMNVGDLVVGKMMGAYTWASASTFNFFPKANVVVLDTDVAKPNEKVIKEQYENVTSSIQEEAEPMSSRISYN